MTDVNQAVTDAADATARAAAEEGEAAKAEAARHTAEAAEAATAAAQASAALADANAAKTINDNKEDMQWLKQHAEATGNSLKNLETSHQSLASSIPEIVKQSQTEMLDNLKSLLTPPKSTQEETQAQEVNPNAEEAAQPEPKPKPKVGPKHRGNWI